MNPTTAAIAFVVAGIVISLAMILYFLWSVYTRGGPKHVHAVAKALREVYDPSWPSKLLGYLPPPESRVDVDDDENGAAA
jgi:hypothetical protein